MRVALLGSGAREHALAWKIAQSKQCEALYIVPGNAGTQHEGENIDLSLKDFAELGAFCQAKQVDCVVVGPEVPLVAGVSDYFSATEGLQAIHVVGPTSAAARIEGSKSYAKAFMQRHGIRTAAARSFRREELARALQYVQEKPLPHVLKADGLAAGKGVILSEHVDTSCYWLHKMLTERHFGSASDQVLIEEHLSGVELSCFVLAAGADYLLLPEAKDYKKVGPSDTDPNTGGMGAVSPVSFVDTKLKQRIHQEIIAPTLLGLHKEGIYYRGFLFFGLMICQGVPYVLEYNVRLGDPEAQVLLPRWKTDILSLFAAMRSGSLSQQAVEVSQAAAVALTLAAEGYPGSYKKGDPIEGLPVKQPQEGLVFHAGTRRRENERIYTAGGRVCSVVAMDAHLERALGQAYALAESIHWPGRFYRKDIGADLLASKDRVS